jgi:hypothetical protein
MHVDACRIGAPGQNSSYRVRARLKSEFSFLKGNLMASIGHPHKFLGAGKAGCVTDDPARSMQWLLEWESRTRRVGWRSLQQLHFLF